MRDPYRALAASIETARSYRTWGPEERSALHLTSAEWDLIVSALHKAAKPYSRGNASEARMRALRQIERRDWPAGEPRLGWLHAGTAKALLRDGLIAERPGTDNPARNLTCIVDLTDAGRAALATTPEGRTDRA